jgi:hypothetical protein
MPTTDTHVDVSTRYRDQTHARYAPASRGSISEDSSTGQARTGSSESSAPAGDASGDGAVDIWPLPWMTGNIFHDVLWGVIMIAVLFHLGKSMLHLLLNVLNSIPID